MDEPWKYYKKKKKKNYNWNNFSADNSREEFLMKKNGKNLKIVAIGGIFFLIISVVGGLIFWKASSSSSSNSSNDKTQLQFTVRYNQEVGEKYEYINVNNSQQCFYIDKDNPIYTQNGLLDKSKQFTISFLKGEAKHLNNNPNYWYFEKNKHSFSLTSLPVPNPNPIKIKWIESVFAGFHYFENLNDSKKEIYIHKDNPVFRGKKLDSSSPTFTFSFLEGNESRNNSVGYSQCYFFEADNNKFTLLPESNWPDEEFPDKEEIWYFSRGPMSTPDGTAVHFVFHRKKGITREEVYFDARSPGWLTFSSKYPTFSRGEKFTLFFNWDKIKGSLLRGNLWYFDMWNDSFKLER